MSMFEMKPKDGGLKQSRRFFQRNQPQTAKNNKSKIFSFDGLRQSMFSKESKRSKDVSGPSIKSNFKINEAHF